MYICLCKGITDTDIKNAIDAGAKSYKDVRNNLGVATVCGSCACMAKDLVKTSSRSAIDDQGAFFQVA